MAGKQVMSKIIIFCVLIALTGCQSKGMTVKEGTVEDTSLMKIRECKFLCVNGPLSIRHSIAEHNNKLAHGLFPVPDRHGPSFRYLMKC